jgi:hypothetical protein
MDNGLLYTYSTIAQALGGAFALLAAFVLYRSNHCKQAYWKMGRLFGPRWRGTEGIACSSMHS